MPMSNMDIVYYTLFPWDNVYSSISLSFTREFAKNNRVFYINPPYSLKDFWTKRNDPQVQARKQALMANKMQYEEIPGVDNTIAAHPPLTIPINFLPSKALYSSLYKRNQKVVLGTIKQVIKDHNLKNFLFFNCYNPYYAGVLPKDFGQKLNIYQCIDDMEEDPYTAKHGLRLEEQALSEADISFVTSTNLLKLKEHLNPGNTHILYNAVDMNIFKDALEVDFPRPKELEGIDTKIIGFTGNLDALRIDYKLIKKTALAHQDKTMVLVGPINSQEFYEVGLDKVPNVIATGGKNIRELPAYLQHFDCTMIPFLCNKVTASIYPLKINEYLAAGKAVVSTTFSEDIKSFNKVIFLAENEENFINAIDTAVASNTDRAIKERFSVANSNTWEARVKQFWSVVEQHLMQSTVS